MSELLRRLFISNYSKSSSEKTLFELAKVKTNQRGESSRQ